MGFSLQFREFTVRFAFFFSMLMSCVNPESQPLKVREIVSEKQSNSVKQIAIPTLKRIEENLNNGPAYAESISNSQLKKFEHLRKFRDQILIGNKSVQVVLAGIPPHASGYAWQPSVVASFEKRNSKWVKISVFESMKVRRFTSGSNPYYPIGIDFGVDSKTGVAYVTVVYTPKEGRAPKAFVKWFLGPKRPILTLISGEGDLGGAKETNWEFLFSSKLGVNLVGKSIPVNNSASRRVTKSKSGSRSGAKHSSRLTFMENAEYDTVKTSSVVRHWGASVIGVIGLGELFYQNRSADFLVKPNPIQAYDLTGFQILLGASGAKNGLGWQGSMKACEESKVAGSIAGKSLDERLFDLLQCSANKSVATVQINPVTMAMSKKNLTENIGKFSGGQTDSSITPLFLMNRDKKPVLYLPLRAQNPVLLYLPPTENYFFSGTSVAKGMLQGRAPVSSRVTNPPIYEIELPERGQLSVELIGELSRQPLVVNISDRYQRSSFAAVASVVSLSSLKKGDSQNIRKFKKVQKLSEGTFLVRDWPIRVELPAAEYKITVTTLDEKKICQLKATSVSGLKIELICEPDFGSEDQINSSIFGLRFSKGRADAPTVIPKSKILTVFDASRNLNLSLIPSNSEIRNSWINYRKSNHKGDLLYRFSRFSKKHIQGRLLVLSCPGPSLSELDYKLAVQRLNPNALQIYGCRSHSPSHRLLENLVRKSSKKTKPRILLPVADFASHARGTVFPKMYPNSGTEDVGLAIREVVKGEFSISSAGQINILDISVVTSKKTSLKNHVRAAIGLVGLPDYSQLSIKINSEKNIVFRGNIRVEKSQKENLKANEQFMIIEFDVDESTEWFRIEILHPAQVNQNPSDLLGATNFVRLKSRKFKR